MTDTTQILDDDYVRRTASFIRSNEKPLAGIQMTKTSPLNPLSWMGTTAVPQKSLVLTLSTTQLSYLLTRMQGIGLDVGDLDIPLENPMGFVPPDAGGRPPTHKEDDTLSISSYVSTLSLSPSVYSWWAAPPSIDLELKYVYSAFTKLPALNLRAPPVLPINGAIGVSKIAVERAALPFDVFKNLQTLTLQDLDPRTLFGWDRLAESLRSLTIRRSGLEDVTNLVVDAVVDDQQRRQRGDHLSPIRRKSLVHRPVQGRARQLSWCGHLGHAAATIPEGEEGGEEEALLESNANSPVEPGAPAAPVLSASKWRRLRHLSLADNNLTFFPSMPLPYLTSITHLDLSTNHLISVPPCLGELYNLVSLNLANNMIESVLGIYTLLGSITTLNLSHNRLDSLCGLERLSALERIDLRNNRIDESDEVGRLALLPNVAQIWVAGNPLVSTEGAEYRVNAFKHFYKEGKEIALDGSPPGWMEKRTIDTALGTPVLGPASTPNMIRSPRSNPSPGHSRVSSLSGALSSPTLVGVSPTTTAASGTKAEGVLAPHAGDDPTLLLSSATTTMHLPPPAATLSTAKNSATLVVPPKKKKKKNTRIVDLDGNPEDQDASDPVPANGAKKTANRRVLRSGASSSDGGSNTSRDLSPAPRALSEAGGFLSSSPLARSDLSDLVKGQEQGRAPTAASSPRSDHASLQVPSSANSSSATAQFLPSTPSTQRTPIMSKTFGRRQKNSTEYVRSTNGFDADELPPLPSSPPSANGMSARFVESADSPTSASLARFANAARRVTPNSATFDGRAMRKESRRSRVTASVYEQSSSQMDRSPNGEANFGDAPPLTSDAEAFRAKIETLRSEVGDSWLKVLSQSGTLGNPTSATSYYDTPSERLTSIVAAASTVGNDMRTAAGRLSPGVRSRSGLSAEI